MKYSSPLCINVILLKCPWETHYIFISYADAVLSLTLGFDYGSDKTGNLNMINRLWQNVQILWNADTVVVAIYSTFNKIIDEEPMLT